MPHVAYKCPDPRMWSLDDNDEVSEIVPIADCLDCSIRRQDRGCPWDYADLLARLENRYSELWSPSRMQGCHRELGLKLQHDYWTDPKEQHKKVRGSSLHAALEVEQQHDVLIGEARVYRTLREADGSPVLAPDYQMTDAGLVLRSDALVPVQISVQPDKIYPTLGVIHDDKTWSYLPVTNGEPNPVELTRDEQGNPTEYVYQLSVGAWAWAAPEKVIYRDGTVNPAPAPIPLHTGQVTIRDASKQLRQEVPILGSDVLESWLRDRVAALKAVYADVLAAGPLAEFCAPEKRWRCKTCPVRYLCGIPAELLKPRTKRSTPKRVTRRKTT